MCAWDSDFARYRALDELLPDVRIQIVQPAALTGICRPSMVDIWVENAISQINEMQPEGPVHLIGYSVAARLNYAVATALRKRGRAIEFLGIVDHYGEFPSLWPTRWTVLAKLIAQNPHWNAVQPILYHGVIQRMKIWSTLALAHLRRSSAPKLLQRIPVPDRSTKFANPDHVEYLEAGRLNQWFAPVPIDVPIELFICDELRDRTQDDIAWWRPFARKGVTAHRLIGDHLTIWEPEHIEEFAEAVGRSFKTSGS